MSKGLDQVHISVTGKQVDTLVMGLIKSADDKNKDVQQAVSDSLLQIGKKHVALVLSSCLHYLVVNLKQLSQEHRIAILKSMERIVKEMLDNIDEQLAENIIKQASSEMTASKDVLPDWQETASDLLVAAGNKFSDKVMEELMLHFQPGVLPHFFVVQTMGKLAIANSYGMVPFIQVMLATMLPMLGMAKHDNMKWVFAHALSRFAESVVDYVENIDQAPDKNVRKEIFSNEFYSAYDVLFNVWLPHAKDAKLRVAVVLALGHISHIIKPEQLKEQMPKLIPGIIALYKKHSDQYPITQSLCMVLDAGTSGELRSLDVLLEIVLNQLHTLMCQPIDYNNSQQLKNHHEVLRCFSMLNRIYSDRVIANLLQRLETPQERIRIGSILVLRHLINAGGTYMEAKKALVVSGMRILLQDPSNKVKKVFAQAIIAMAHHGYLELEGGESMIEFIIKQCALKDEPLKKRDDPEYVTAQALRSMCESVLQLITTTIDIMERVLWPYLLEFVIPLPFTDATSVLCKNLNAIAEKKRESNDADYLIDYESEVNLPQQTEVISRLMVLAGLPQNGKKRGEHVLKAMMSLCPNLKDELVSIWDDVIPKMVLKLQEMEDADDKWNQKKWEDLMLRLLSASLNAVQDEEWVVQLGDAFGSQLPLYRDYHEEKNFCYKCLGVVMRKSTKKEFLHKQMSLMFTSVNHHQQLEREGVAVGLGFTAASHFDTVLNKLEEMVKSDGGKKSSGFLGFIKDTVKSDSTEQEKPRHTIMLAYGYVTFYAPITLVTSRVEAVILRNLQPHFANQKDTILKRSLINTVELIAKALDPMHLQSTHEFTQKKALMEYLMACVKHESMERLYGMIRSAAYDACAALVKLDPIITDAELFEVVKTCVDSVVGLPVDGSKKGKSESYDDQIVYDELMQKTVVALMNMLQEILHKDFSPSSLKSVLKHILPWLISSKAHERERAATIAHQLLVHYLENVSEINVKSEFILLGEIVGRLIPRCTDPSIRVREDSILALQAALRIELRRQGKADGEHDKMIDAMPLLKERLQKSDATILFSAVNDLAKVIAKKFPAGEQMKSLLEVLMEGLADPEALCSNGACVVLNGCAKLRGAELGDQVEFLLTRLHDKMQYVTNPQTKTGALRCVKSLASHHLCTVLNTLLKLPLPYDQTVVEFWQVLAKESSLLDNIITTYLDMLKQNMPYEEAASASDKKVMERKATALPLSIVSSFGHMFAVEEAKDKVVECTAPILAALLLKVGAYAGSKAPTVKAAEKDTSASAKIAKSASKGKSKLKDDTYSVVPSRIVVDALSQFMQLIDCKELTDYANQNSLFDEIETEENYVRSIECMARAVALYQTDQLEKIIVCLNPCMSNLYDTDRVVATAFFGELIRMKCGGNMELVEMLCGFLMGRLIDSCIKVRMLCVRGLGNVAETGVEMVQKYSTTVLSAMISGMDDKDDLNDIVTLEAINGLSKILESINESHIRPILINIALKIKPCFEKDQASVRAAAFELFGNLSKFGNGPSAMPFLEQIHDNLTSILLHLNDQEAVVIKACKHTLKLIGCLLGSNSLNEMFQKYLIAEGHLHYGEFMNDLCKILVADFTDKVPFYIMRCVTFFKSQWPEMRGNAAIYTGFLMNALPQNCRSLVSKDHVCSALLTLLRDPDSTVRCKAAEAMSNLSDY